MATITPGRIEIDRSYAITDAAPVLDSARCPIDPDKAIVRFSVAGGGALRATYVVVKGKRLRGARTLGRYKQGGWSIRTDGTVEPDYRGGTPAAWVQDVVDRAITEQHAGFGLTTVSV